MSEGRRGEIGSNEAAQGNFCPRCGKRFICGMAAGEEVCWCVAHPPIFAVPGADAACYCPDCLAELVAQRRSAIET
ncbi:MAG: cysteine-rich CWC family protein [Azoarcus sp.]|nr:cysteine-rich CWC family protein [Azoarcus sp.]